MGEQTLNTAMSKKNLSRMTVRIEIEPATNIGHKSAIVNASISEPDLSNEFIATELNIGTQQIIAEVI